MAPHGKELSEDLKKRIVALHKDGVGYKKIAKTLKLSCSTVAKTIQRFNRTGSTQNRHRHGRPKKLSACAQRHIQSIAAEVEGMGGQPVSAQTIRRTLHQIGLHGCHPRRKPLLKMMHKKARSLLKTSRLRTWIAGTMSCGLIRLRYIYLVQMVSSVCGGNQVRSTKTIVSCLQSSMVVGVPWSGAAWVLPALESYSSLREPSEPILSIRRIRKLRRAPETPGGPLTLNFFFEFELFLNLASGYENINYNLL